MPTGATQEEEIITGPKDGDSLANDLDNRREVTDDMLMGGHPNQMLEEEHPEGGEGGEILNPPEQPGGSPEGGEAPKSPEVKEVPTGPRFKSQEEAEKAHAEAERRMHEATTQAAKDREVREAIERELAELRQAKSPEKKEEPLASTPSVTPEERKKKLVEVAKVANKKAVSKIRDLDTQDPDYDDNVAAAWAEANAEALLEAGIGSTAGLSREEVATLVKDQVKAERESERASRTEREAQDESTQAYSKALDLAKGAGLDMAEDSADRIMFDALAPKMPDELKNKGAEAIQEKVNWVVTEVRKRLGKAVLTEAEKAEAARKAQEENQPLGRGGDNRKPKLPPKQDTGGSLASDFEDARRTRIIS